MVILRELSGFPGKGIEGDRVSDKLCLIIYVTIAVFGSLLERG